MAAFTVGEVRPLAGDITTLNWIVPGYDDSTETNLGYHAGRLAEGYWIALLRDVPRPADFIFAGTTMRSGGRQGLPQATSEAEEARRHMHDLILAERGTKGYRELQESALASRSVKGGDRLAKVLPVIRHDGDMPPNVQYPMGGGGLQWTLRRKCNFLIAALFAPDGVTETEAGVWHTRRSYEDRAGLRRFLQSA